jgi:prepilin-type processing-associated H-X9-DG protein
MYCENSRICVNMGVRATGVPQTRLSTLSKPSQTVFLGEQDPNASHDASDSTVTGYYAVARHSNGKLGNFSMCDGSVRSATTNEFARPMSGDTAALEWSVPDRPFYWYPAIDTPN